MSRSSCALALALVGSMASVSASGASSANVRLDNLRVVLVDLNPSDGIAPSVTFSNENSSGEVWTLVTSAGTSRFETGSFVGPNGSWSPGAAALGGSYASASIALSGAGMLTGSSLVAAGAAVSPADGFCVPGNPGFNECYRSSASFSGSARPMGVNPSFVLSANTRMTISAEAAISVSASGGGRIEEPVSAPTVQTDRASAWLTMILLGPGSDGNGQQLSGESKNLVVTSSYDALTGTFLPGSDSYSNTINASFTNMTSAGMTGNFLIDVLFSGMAVGNALLVPEPGTWALMLGGLVALGSLVHRRRLT